MAQPQPPSALLNQAAKMPTKCYALWIVKNGQVQNAEFAVWDLDSYYEEMWKFRKNVNPDELKGCHVVAWVKFLDHFKTVNLNSVTVE
jgi:hypothetical protein